MYLCHYNTLSVTQDEAQYVCVVQIEGVQINLTAAVERRQDNTHTFTCSPHQVTPLWAHAHSPTRPRYFEGRVEDYWDVIGL